MKKVEEVIAVRWSDCDANRHVRHSAYYDYAAHVRIKYFSDMGFSTATMDELNLGPILFKEECSFIRELKPNDFVTVNFLKGDINADGSRWVMHHEIYNGKGEKCAHITTKGAWMDLQKRKLTIPPTKLFEAMKALAPGDYYTYKKSKS